MKRKRNMGRGERKGEEEKRTSRKNLARKVYGFQLELDRSPQVAKPHCCLGRIRAAGRGVKDTVSPS